MAGPEPHPSSACLWSLDRSGSLMPPSKRLATTRAVHTCSHLPPMGVTSHDWEPQPSGSPRSYHGPVDESRLMGAAAQACPRSSATPTGGPPSRTSSSSTLRRPWGTATVIPPARRVLETAAAPGMTRGRHSTITNSWSTGSKRSPSERSPCAPSPSPLPPQLATAIQLQALHCHT